MKRFGIAAILSVVDKNFSKGMMRAGKNTRGFKGRLSVASKALRSFGRGLAKAGKLIGVAAGGAGISALTAAIGFSIKKFTDFSGAMGALKAKLGQEAAPAFGMLESKAKELGMTTQFTAIQAADAMKTLATAGFKPLEIISSIGPVLNAAAAEEMNLATAADIVASNIRAFRLEAEDATRVADVLAFVSSKTNTSMTALQEGMKFAAPVAKEMNVSFEDTAATLGLLADIGIKGTLSGTAFKNAMLKMAKGAKHGKIALGRFNAEVVKNEEGGIDVRKTMLNMGKALEHIQDPMERGKALMKALGLRGIALPGAFKAALKDTAKMSQLFENLATNADGAAKKMAKMRLDNIKGDFVKLSSAIEGAAIGLGGALVQSLGLRKGVQSLTETVSGLAKAFEFFARNPDMINANEVAIEGLSSTTIKTAQAIIQNMQEWGQIIKRVGQSLKEMSQSDAFRLLSHMLGGKGFAAPVKGLGAREAGLAEASRISRQMLDFFRRGRKLQGPIQGIAADVTREQAQASVKDAIKNLSNRDQDFILRQVSGVLNQIPASGIPVETGSKVTLLNDVPGTKIQTRVDDIDRGMKAYLSGAKKSDGTRGGSQGAVTPPQQISGNISVTVPVKIDGREVAVAVGKAKLDDMQRSGAKIKPGERRALMQRGFSPAF